jgi:hypothetical protein
MLPCPVVGGTRFVLLAALALPAPAIASPPAADVAAAVAPSEDEPDAAAPHDENVENVEPTTGDDAPRSPAQDEPAAEADAKTPPVAPYGTASEPEVLDLRDEALRSSLRRRRVEGGVMLGLSPVAGVALGYAGAILGVASCWCSDGAVVGAVIGGAVGFVPLAVGGTAQLVKAGKIRRELRGSARLLPGGGAAFGLSGRF